MAEKQTEKPVDPQTAKENPEQPKHKTQEAVYAEIAQDTKIPPPFKPVDPLTAMGSPNGPVLMVMLRQLRDMQGPMPDTRGGALEVMDQLQTRFKNGQDITDLQEKVTSYVTGQQERNELLNLLSDSLDWERAMEIMKSRAKFEDFCHACMRRSDLNVAEGMALSAFMNNQLSDILSRIRPKQSRTEAQAAANREPGDLIQRANLPTQLQNKQIQSKFDEASPSEREILRKLGSKLELMLAARITKTTTETVEIVQKENGSE